MVDELLSPQEMDEKAQKWVKDNALSLVMGVLIGVGFILGYNYYQDKKQTEYETASLLYSKVEAAFVRSEMASIEGQVKELKTQYPDSPYAAKAVLMYAKQLSIKNIEEAISEYQWVMNHADEIGAVEAAKIRQSKLYLANGQIGKAKQIAQSNTDSYFVTYYQEILGDIAVKENQLKDARGFYQQALDGLMPSNQQYQTVLRLKILSLPTVEEEVSASNDK